MTRSFTAAAGPIAPKKIWTNSISNGGPFLPDVPKDLLFSRSFVGDKQTKISRKDTKIRTRRTPRLNFLNRKQQRGGAATKSGGCYNAEGSVQMEEAKPNR